MTAQPLRPAPDRASGRRVGLLVTWALATGGGLLVASTTKIGPVVLAITANHGVHTGDLVGFALFYGVALLATLVFRPRRPRPVAGSTQARPVSAPAPSWTPPPAPRWPLPQDPWSHGGGFRHARADGAGFSGTQFSGTQFSGTQFSGTEAATHRLRAAPRRPMWSDDEPTRPIRLGNRHPDDPYGRRAG